MHRHGMFGSITTLPGKRDELVSILVEASRLQGAMNGCENYIVHTSPTDPDVIYVSEVWHSKADHEAALKSDAVRALITRGRPLIASMGDRFETTPVGGKGLNG